jgi:hypothetical protein
MSLKRDRTNRIDNELKDFIVSFNDATKKKPPKEQVGMDYVAEQYRKWLNYESLSASYMSNVLSRNKYCWNRSTQKIVPIASRLPDEINVYNRLFHIFISIKSPTQRSDMEKWLRNNPELNDMILTIFSNDDGLFILSADPAFYSTFKYEYGELPPNE